MIINHNISAMNAQRNMAVNTNAASRSMEKLSSGLRINRAGDDAAGLAISEKMRGQIRGLDQASTNSQDGISLIQTAEGALNETHSILQRMRELAVQSANDTNTDDDRVKIQSEVDELAKEITRISNTTEFNTQNLLAGGLNDTFQVGANKGQNINLSIGAMDAETLGVAGSNVTTSFENTNTAVSKVVTTSPNLNGQFVSVKGTNASATDATDSNANGGALSIVDKTKYTGSSDKTYQVKIDGKDDDGKVTAASYSTDGGKTWTNATKAGDNFKLNDGLEVTITAKKDDTDDTTKKGNTVGDTYTFKATAKTLEFQINSKVSGDGTTVGKKVTVHNDKSSVAIGDAESNSSMTVNFDFDTVFSRVGTTAAAGDEIKQTVDASTKAEIGADGKVATEATVKKGIDVSTQGAADSAIEVINNAITKVSEQRSKLGAMQNRLEHTTTNLQNTSENLSAAESRIRDVDMAKEMLTYSKNNILQQAAQSMIAQAKSAPENVLQLLR